MKKSILIVDDSPTMYMSIEAILKRAGFETRATASGEAALRVLHDGFEPDLMITDLNMGGMNGLELIREARQLAALRFVPMLLLTIEGRTSKRHEAKVAGASGWLVKPIEGQELLKVIRQLLPVEST